MEAPMFTVEEIGESIQSEPKESKDNDKKGSKFGEGNVTKDYVTQLMAPQNCFESISQYRIAHEDKENLNDNQLTM
jgi:hypothetical protein